VDKANHNGETALYIAAENGHGRAVQVKPMKPMLKAPGTKRLKLKYIKLLSRFAFNFNLRRYTMRRRCARWWVRGRAVQVDPIKPTLKAPGTSA